MDISRSAEQQEADDHFTASQLTESLAKAETRSVSILRIAVISALLLTAAVVSAGVYLYTSNEEQSNFTNHFEDSAHQVVERYVTKSIVSMAWLTFETSNTSSLFRQLP